jgi:hypothetical protein
MSVSLDEYTPSNATFSTLCIIGEIESSEKSSEMIRTSYVARMGENTNSNKIFIRKSEATVSLNFIPLLRKQRQT